jgi:hypothetical protein
MDWRHYTKLPGIKDLPLYEQKRRFMKMIIESEESIRQHQNMMTQQAFGSNPSGYAAGAPDSPKFTAAIELLTQEGFVLITESGFNLIME